MELMSPPPLLPFRDLARGHVAAAKALLQGQGAPLRYACLELRLALEALTYDVLQSYQDDLDDAVDIALKEWHPAAILEGLAGYDPIGDATLVMDFKFRLPGQDWQSIVGREERFTAAWAASSHRALSSFLHQLTVGQLRKGRKLDEAKLRAKTSEILDKLEAVLACPFHDLRLGFRFGYDCPDCGGGLSVALLVLMTTGRAKTTCPDCGALWRAEDGGTDNRPVFTRLSRGRRPARRADDPM
jgi:transcription elongation factor Elf1